MHETETAQRALERLPGFAGLASGMTIDVALRYFAFAGAAWLLGYALFKRRWMHRKIVPSHPPSSEMAREIRWSLLTVVIFGMVGALTITAARHGWTQIYWRIDERGWGWFVASIALTILLHDTYFYWTHRLMHHPRLFRIVHRVHHESRNPTPWASYAFGPIEAFVQAGIFPFAVTVMPIHPLAFMLFMFWQITFNVLGHTGYEFHPRRLMDSWLRRVLNTPTNHVMHHETLRGNFGLYFNIWDRLMRTNHADYEERFREVTRRAPEIAADEAGMLNPKSP